VNVIKGSGVTVPPRTFCRPFVNVIKGEQCHCPTSHMLQGLCERDKRVAMSLSHFAHIAGPFERDKRGAMSLSHFARFAGP